jgi:hypothetical protein
MNDDSDFKRASDTIRQTNLDGVEKALSNRTWVNPTNRRIDVSSLPMCPKENGGCGHHVQRQSAVACYNDQGVQQPCTCVCELYLPKGGCQTCDD